MRSFGMTPVFPGFAGFIPRALLLHFPDLKAKKSSNWCDFSEEHCCVWLLDSGDPLFQKIGFLFVQLQRETYGSDNVGFYAVDVFNEMVPSQSDPDYLKETSRAVYNSMHKGDPSTVWIMQGWLFYSDLNFWKPAQIQAVLSGVPKGKLVLLDLYAERHPQWKRTEAFYGRPFIWCTLHNFGGNTEMHGAATEIAHGLTEALTAKVNAVGTGMCPEALEQNPVVYELASEIACRQRPPDLDDWFRSYARQRYAGRPCPAADRAWRLLRWSVYQNTTRRPETVMDITTSRPGLESKEVIWGLKPHIWYSPRLVMEAWEALLQCSGQLHDLSSYRYDLVDVGRQVMSKLAGKYWKAMQSAYLMQEIRTFKMNGDRLLELLEDLDDLVSTHEGFLLGSALIEAKRWGGNEEEMRFMEQNLKLQLSIWGTSPSGNTELSDYANKQWSGLIRSFYRERWRMWIERCVQDLKLKRPYNALAFIKETVNFTHDWIAEDNGHAFLQQPRGNPIAVATTLFTKYRNEIA